MNWIRADASDFGGTIPIPRSGHTAVNVGKSKLVVFGGFADKRFLDDIAVYDIENKRWFTPECTGSRSEGQVGPSPRAFHVAVAIECNMFIFGGRSGSKRLGDFWMLDTDIWQWSELTSYGDLPSQREFASASAIGKRKVVMYGGWDGKKWLSDVYILDTMSLEWTELSITGSGPPPRCGQTATMVEKRLLVFGGRGGGGQIMGDLWALKGLIEEENETPGWTLLKLPGQSPSPRCGHTVTSGGHYLLLFGGHGTGGWLSRYDIYYNDCIILDRVWVKPDSFTSISTADGRIPRVSVQWKRLPTVNDPPPARAYHSMSHLGSRYLLFGGFDGKTTFADLWWLVPEDDPIAKRSPPSPSRTLSERKPVLMSSDSSQSLIKESQVEENPIMELQRRLGISVFSSRAQVNFVDEIDDKELLELSSRLAGETVSFSDPMACVQKVQALRDHWKNSSARSLKLRELGPLLRDYQRLVVHHHLESLVSDEPFTTRSPGAEVCRFFHLKSVSQLRMDDIPELLTEYKQLIMNP